MRDEPKRTKADTYQDAFDICIKSDYLQMDVKKTARKISTKM